jgi:DNA-binding transcriptional ArsR family regulator
MTPERGRAAAGRSGVMRSAPVFGALGDPTRLRLVTSLSERGPQSITCLTRGTRLTRQAITKHLRVLSGAGLVRGRRLGRESRWELEPAGIDVARRYLDRVSERWDEALQRLRDLVEE